MKTVSVIKGISGMAVLIAGMWAVTARAVVAPGTVVLSNNWEALGGVTITTPTVGIATSWITDDSGAAPQNWATIGGVDANRKIEFRTGENSPFTSGNVSAVLMGDPANNGPRLYTGGADLNNNLSGLVVQFDTKINALDSFAGLVINADAENDFLGVRLGNGGAGVGKVLAPVQGGTGFVSTTPLADFSLNTWYRFTLQVPGALATATTYNLQMIEYGGATNTWLNLPISSNWNRGTLTTIQLHSWGLDVAGAGNFGEWHVDNVLVSLMVPEPSTAVLLGLGGWLLWRRRPRGV